MGGVFLPLSAVECFVEEIYFTIREDGALEA
jgi:hypothetical protein